MVFAQGEVKFPQPSSPKMWPLKSERLHLGLGPFLFSQTYMKLVSKAENLFSQTHIELVSKPWVPRMVPGLGKSWKDKVGGQGSYNWGAN